MRNIALVGEYAILGAASGAVYSVRISDPKNLVQESLISLSGNIADIDASGRYAYISQYSGRTGIAILDISDPASLIEVGFASTTNAIYEVSVGGGYVYASGPGTSDNVFVVDVRDPENPATISEYTLGSDADSIFVSGGQAFVGSTMLHILDISGAQMQSLFAHSFAASNVSILNNTDVAGNLYVKSGINAGAGGIMSDGVLSVNSTSSSFFGGNVGIGTTTPSSKLTVAGDAYITGALRDSSNSAGSNGFVLQTTGNGTEWVATSSLGFAASSSVVTAFTGLTDTPSSFTANRIPFTNSAGDALIDNDNLVFDGTNLGLGTSTPSTLLSLEKTGVTGNGTVAGVSQQFSITTSGSYDVVYGSELNINNTPSAANALLGSIIRVTDDSSYANIVRGLEVQTDLGANTLGENTALSGYARTFGVRGVTSGDAGGSYIPAGLYGQTDGTSQGNAIRGYSETITSANLLSLLQETSTFTGDGLSMNFGTAGGSFTGNFIDLQNDGTTNFNVSATGTAYIAGNLGLGTTTPNSRLSVSGDTVLSGLLTIGGDILPNTTLTYDLGSSTSRFKNVWAETVNVGTSTWSIWNGGNDRLAFSNQAEQGGTEALTILSNGNVGVGTGAPASELTVTGDVALSGRVLVNSPSLAGLNSEYNIITEGRVSVQEDGGSGNSLEFRYFNGRGGMLAYNRDTTSYLPATVEGSEVGLYVSGNEVLTVDTNERVGIGTSTPSAQLTTTGSVRFATFGAGTVETDASGNLTVSSDERLKNILNLYSNGVDVIRGLEPIAYEWNAEPGLMQEYINIGFSAQNVQQFIPEAVGTTTNGYLSLSTRPILAALVNASKEQQTVFDALLGIDTSIATSTTGMLSEVREESLWSKLVSFFDGFVDGVLEIVGLRTQELCVYNDSGETCVDRDSLDALLQNANVAPSSSTSTDTNTDTNTNENQIDNTATNPTTVHSTSTDGSDDQNNTEYTSTTTATTSIETAAESINATTSTEVASTTVASTTQVTSTATSTQDMQTSSATDTDQASVETLDTDKTDAGSADDTNSSSTSQATIVTDTETSAEVIDTNASTSTQTSTN